jgi:hypothetical protein
MLGFLWASKQDKRVVKKTNSLSALDRARSDGSAPSTATTTTSGSDQSQSDQCLSSSRHDGELTPCTSMFGHSTVTSGSAARVQSESSASTSTHLTTSGGGHKMVEDYFRRPVGGPGHRSAPPSQMYARFAPQRSAEPRRCPSPPPGGVRGGVDVEEVRKRGRGGLGGPID